MNHSAFGRRKIVLSNIKFNPYDPHPYKYRGEIITGRTAGQLNYSKNENIIRNKTDHGANAVEILKTSTIKKFRVLMKEFRIQKKQRKFLGSFSNFIVQIKTSKKTPFTLKQYYIAINQYPKYVLRGIFDRLHQLFIGNRSFHKQLRDLYINQASHVHLNRAVEDKIYDYDRNINNHLLQITQSCIILMNFMRECKPALMSINYEAYFNTAKHILKLCTSYIKVKNAFINSLKLSITNRNLKFTAFEKFPKTGGLLLVIQNIDRRSFNNRMYKEFVAHENVSLNVKRKVPITGDVSHKYRYTNFSKILNGRPTKYKQRPV